MQEDQECQALLLEWAEILSILDHPEFQIDMKPLKKNKEAQKNFIQLKKPPNLIPDNTWLPNVLLEISKFINKSLIFWIKIMMAT